MEPITVGAIALLALIGNKFVDWSTEKALDAIYDKAKEVIKAKSPATAAALETAAAQAALPPGEREDIGEAVLVEDVKKAAEADPEIKEAVEALGNQVNTAAQDNPELKKAIAELTAAIKAQSPTTVENWQGINIKGGENTISNPTLNFGSK
ncbi:hypothetical protein H6G76_12515 [Nostoc sp. FACHB-152]|uniref:hypothetical protein n=1 Tax=unclassified Nostoc TaxID=2593658 RepID=UPI001685045A|nr:MULTISPECIES: hypothetical protein [unclassified Nostoc]MBD2447988.1 hypothetical protein [Nostoc sp. FACHB-152]MBD2466095.1 hypothetical protein [Nostoc sp. FACHB-145]